MLRPLFLLTPILAETIAKAGWSKSDVKRYLYEHARISASSFENYSHLWTFRPDSFSIKEQHRLGNVPDEFWRSSDPERLVPIVFDPEDFMIIVTGDPLRTNAYSFVPNGNLGYPVARKIEGSPAWLEKVRAASDE
jgi:hypothetical protein